MSTAHVHIGLMEKVQIVRDFYTFSKRETVDIGQIETGDISHFDTLEELVDNILASERQIHVIVNHGSPEDGLLVRFTSNSPHNATGVLVHALADLAKSLAQGTLPNHDPRVIDAASRMKVDPLTAIRLVTKLAQLRLRTRVMHLRGCSMGGNSTLLTGYKLLFNATLVTAPSVRMFYLRIHPHGPGKGTSIPLLANQPPLKAKTRRRLFTADDGSAGALLLDVRDINGSTKVDSDALLDNPAEAPRWGALLTGRWTQVTDPSFVLPVLWGNDEKSYHTPLEVGYRNRLSHV